MGAIIAGAIIAGAIVAGAIVVGVNIVGAFVAEQLSRSNCRLHRSNCRRSNYRRSICRTFTFSPSEGGATPPLLSTLSFEKVATIFCPPLCHYLARARLQRSLVQRNVNSGDAWCLWASLQCPMCDREVRGKTLFQTWDVK